MDRNDNSAFVPATFCFSLINLQVADDQVFRNEEEHNKLQLKLKRHRIWIEYEIYQTA